MIIFKVILFILAAIVVFPVTLAVWIPLMVRMVALIAFTAIASVFTKAHMGEVRAGLDEAIHLPFTVFQKMVEAVFDNGSPSDSSREIDPNGKGKFYSELFFALIFWLTTVFVVAEGMSDPLALMFGQKTPPAKIQPAGIAYKFTGDSPLTFDVYRKGGLFSDESTGKFRVTPQYLAYNSREKSSILVLTLCLLSKPTYDFSSFFAWYTDARQQTSVRWSFNASPDLVSFRPGECKSLTLTSEPESKQNLPILAEESLGDLHFSFNTSDSFGELNLAALLNRGELRVEKLSLEDFAAYVEADGKRLKK